MSEPRERLESLLERLERLRRTRPAVPAKADDATLSPSQVVHLPSSVPPSTPSSDMTTVLELLAIRDRYIQSELQRLQRTLSRQTFRGAESARRLVRRLARRAEQNAADVEALRTSRAL